MGYITRKQQDMNVQTAKRKEEKDERLNKLRSMAFGLGGQGLYQMYQSNKVNPNIPVTEYEDSGWDEFAGNEDGTTPLASKKSGFKMKGSPMKRNFGV